MKQTAPLAAMALLLAGCSTVPPPKPSTAIISVPAGPIDEYAELREFAQQRPATLGADGQPLYTLAWMQAHRRELHQRGLAFLEKYPGHPLRWDVVLLIKAGPDWKEVPQGWGPSIFIPDPELSKAWNARCRSLLEQLVVAPDASSRTRREALWALITDGGREFAGNDSARDPATLEKLRTWVLMFEREYKDTGGESAVYSSYAAALVSVSPDQAFAFLERTKALYPPDTAMHRRTRQFLDGYARYLRAKKEPGIEYLWQQLGALDPTFNPEKYRGKVVVLCMGPVEYPSVRFHLQQTRDLYGANGVEIIQVASLDRAVGRPPAAEQRDRMQALVREHHLSWPVIWNPNDHFSFANEWGRSGIPAGLVFDRSGKVGAEGLTAAVVGKIVNVENNPTADTHALQ